MDAILDVGFVSGIRMVSSSVGDGRAACGFSRRCVKRDGWGFVTMSEREYWEAMCHQAACRVPSVYSATFFSRRNISIVDQQSRCFNLCWSLAKLKRVRSTQHVAVIGGGISGMTCAVALAAWTDCVVTVFERDSVQLKRFRRAGHRYIHPDLNHRGGDDGHLVYDPRKPTRFPFMNWSGNYAPAFAEELIAKFDHYRSTLNIALCLATKAGTPSSVGGRVELVVASGTQRKTMTFDSVILATGFGEERLGLSAHTNDTSYWLSGNPLGYRASPLRKRGRDRVLVSGNGDSAVIELAHVLIRGFDHENILDFLPSNSLAPRLNREYAARVAGLAHRQIEHEQGGVLRWFEETRELHELNPGMRFYRAQGFDLRRDLYATGTAVRESPQFEKTLLEKFKELASREIKACVDDFMLHRIFRRTVKSLFRRDVEVVVTGRTPTIYSVAQAPLNWFLLRLLSHYGALSYHQTELVNSRLVKNLVRCEFKDRSLNGSFHRVITRHGPDFLGFAMDSTLRSQEPNPSGYMPPGEHFFSWVKNHNGFRTRRLLDAQRRRLPLSDEPYPGSPGESKAMLRDADYAMWACHGSRQEPRVTDLYRRLKRSRSLKERSGLSAQLLEVTLTILEKQGKKKLRPR